MPTLIYDPADIDFDKPGINHYQVAFHFDGAWGYSLIPLTVINGLRGSNPNGVICFGGTHGNEYEGQVSVKRLCHDLRAEDISGRIILIPQLSESACNANTRTSPLDSVNMNRAFPGNGRGTISSRIANFVKSRIFPLGRIVLDIHSGGREGSFPLCTSFHPIPDEAQRAEIARVARLFDTPFVFIYASTMASGLLTDEAEAEGKITIGGEFGGGETVDRFGVHHAYEGIRNVLKHYGLLEGQPVKIRPQGSEPPKLVRADKLQSYVPCPRDGIWEPVIALGERVTAGQLIGRLHDFQRLDEPGWPVRATLDGIVVAQSWGARVRQGQFILCVGVEQPW